MAGGGHPEAAPRSGAGRRLREVYTPAAGGLSSPGEAAVAAAVRRARRGGSHRRDPGGAALADVRYARLLRGLAARALRRPRLLPLLARAAWRFRARDWYRRPPFLPLPPAAYVAWRLETAYGAADVLPPSRELERYLRWTLGGGVRSGGHA